MPVAMDDFEDNDGSWRKASRSQDRRWWKPTGTMGRVLAGVVLVTLLAAAGVAVQTTRHYLDRDSRFRVEGAENLQVTGIGQVTRADLVAVFGGDIGRNIFFVPLAERRAQIEQIPWVERATVMRLLPDRIRVSVVERKPVAFVRQAGHIGLVDANGVLLDMPAAAMAQHYYSFPVLSGIDTRDPLPSRKARVALYLRLMGDLDANGQHNSDQISEIDLTDPEDARVVMPEQGSDILAHFGEDHFLERYQRYKAHIAEWRQQYPHLSAVDLRYDQQVVLEMKPGADAAPTSQTVNPSDSASSPAPAAAVPSKPSVGAPRAPAVNANATAAAKVNASSSPSHSVVKNHGNKSAIPRHDSRKSQPVAKKKQARPSQAEIERAAARQRALRARRQALQKRAAHSTSALPKKPAVQHETQGQ
jgi:cell division protein FtsQ